MANIKDLQRAERPPQHSVTIKRDGIEREEVYLWFLASWRGEPAAVTMQADRYSCGTREEVAAGRLSPWRIYATEARTKSDDPGAFGAHLSDTARHRLSDACKPLVEEYLAGAEYLETRRAAIGRAVLAGVDDLRLYLSSPTGDLRRRLEAHRAELEPAAAELLERAADAIDAARAVYLEAAAAVERRTYDA